MSLMSWGERARIKELEDGLKQIRGALSVSADANVKTICLVISAIRSENRDLQQTYEDLCNGRIRLGPARA